MEDIAERFGTPAYVYSRASMERAYRRLDGAFGKLPRVKASTKGEGHERRYFYGSVWAVCWAQPTLWLMWKAIPRTTAGDILKLVVFLGVLGFVGNLARLGRLPRTRPIVPGEIAVSD